MQADCGGRGRWSVRTRRMVGTPAPRGGMEGSKGDKNVLGIWYLDIILVCSRTRVCVCVYVCKEKPGHRAQAPRQYRAIAHQHSRTHTKTFRKIQLYNNIVWSLDDSPTRNRHHTTPSREQHTRREEEEAKKKREENYANNSRAGRRKALTVVLGA